MIIGLEIDNMKIIMLLAPLMVITPITVAAPDVNTSLQTPPTEAQQASEKPSETEEPTTQVNTPETTQEAEKRIYDEIIGGDEYKAYVLKIESGFAPNNIYAPTKAVSSEGKSGLCQLQSSTDNDLWSQNELCDKYVDSRYGSWYEAYVHEINYNWF